MLLVEVTACGCVFKEITLAGSNQDNFYENTTTALFEYILQLPDLLFSLHAIFMVLIF
jgi:hypothetical protein